MEITFKNLKYLEFQKVQCVFVLRGNLLQRLNGNQHYGFVISRRIIMQETYDTPTLSSIVEKLGMLLFNLSQIYIYIYIKL